MKNELQTLKANTLAEIEKAEDTDQLRNIEINILGRKGQLTAILRQLKDLSPEEKKEIGMLANKIKTEITAEITKRFADLSAKDGMKKTLDVSEPGKTLNTPGHIHVLTQVQERVEHIFGEMGFAIHDGPEIESEYYNFEGLNIPEHHPARDMQDTFFLDEAFSTKKGGRTVLRTHTSPVQVRTMEKYGAPLRIIVPGRVFRNEATDASHDATFNQVEGLLIDKNISLAHLKGVMMEFLSRLFRKDVKVRFRPGYFPFVEPGLELDFSCLLCSGEGCRVCKYTGWVEFMGAGMVHPNVLKAGGIDPDEYQGWAFGFGLTRLAMMRYGITDIRLLHSGDLRFNHQF